MKSNNELTEAGIKSALRLNSYSSFFETLGLILQVFSAISSLLIVAILLGEVDRYENSNVWIEILLVVIIGFLAFVQATFMRGLASYFRIKAIEYLSKQGYVMPEKRNIEKKDGNLGPFYFPLAH